MLSDPVAEAFGLRPDPPSPTGENFCSVLRIVRESKTGKTETWLAAVYILTDFVLNLCGFFCISSKNVSIIVCQEYIVLPNEKGTENQRR